MSKATPRFRRGFHPSWYGYVRATYETVNLDHADEVWRRICHHKQIIGSKNIMATMQVSSASAAKYRRLFDALDLVHSIRGYYVPDADVDDIIPAELEVCSHDPDALLHLTSSVSAAYVLARGTREAPADKVSMIRFADGSRPSAIWVAQPSLNGGPACFSVRHIGGPLTTTTNRDLVRESVSPDDWVPSDTPPPVVVLVKEPERLAALTNERSESSTTCLPVALMALPDSMSAPQVRKVLGCSRATAHRRLDQWVAEGWIVKTGYGKWSKVG